MADPRNLDHDVTHRSAPHVDPNVRPTDDLYAEQDDSGLTTGRYDSTTPNARPRNGRWGRIALIAAAVILGLALLSVMFTGPETDEGDLATAPAVETTDPIVTGSTPDTDAVIVPEDEIAVTPETDETVAPETDAVIVPAN